MLISMLQGLSMSLADSVPGVSGGTIAFILGFYEKFLGALHDLIGKDRNLRRSAFVSSQVFGRLGRRHDILRNDFV